GIRVDKPEDVGPAWDRALASDRPVVYEALTDPEVPTLPPHITFKEAENFVKSIVKGDSGAPGMIRGAFKDAIESFIPHKD
ncbi:MAG: thiamine pyrophosphate-requiring protein, partial [Chthoniobacterales bacterium]